MEKLRLAVARFTALIYFFTSVIGFTLPVMGQVNVVDGKYARNLDSESNFVKNKGCYENTSNITFTGTTLTRNTTNPLEYQADCAIDATASAQTFAWATFNLERWMKGQNCEAGFVFQGDASLYKTYAMVNSVKVSNDLQLTNSSTNPFAVSIPFPCGSQPLTTQVVIESTSASAAPFNAAKFYVGPLRKIQTVTTRKKAIRLTWTGTQTAFHDTETEFTFPNGTTTIASMDGFTHNGSAIFTSTATQECDITARVRQTNVVDASVIRQHHVAIYKNGVTTGERAGAIQGLAGNNINSGGSLGALPDTLFTGKISFNSGDNFQVYYYQANGAGSNRTMERLKLDVDCDTSITVLKPNLPVLPTVTRILSGSGTYTPPAGATYLEVTAVGGGGGGGGSGSSSGGSAGNGGNTTFGSSLITANGGTGGLGNSAQAPFGAGGSFTVNSPAVIVSGSIGSGGAGGGVTGPSGGNGVFAAPNGGGTCLAGGGYGGLNEGGQDGRANTGGGAAGGGTQIGAGLTTGQGGGGGGCVTALITSPAASYSYSIGAGGTSGAAGISGRAGGTGGTGVLVIKEYYQSGNAPLLVNSVVSSSTGIERIERAVSNTNCTASPCTLTTSTPGITVTRTGTGAYVANFSPAFAAIPSCSGWSISQGNFVTVPYYDGGGTASTFPFHTIRPSTEANFDSTFTITCVGPK